MNSIGLWMGLLLAGAPERLPTVVAQPLQGPFPADALFLLAQAQDRVAVRSLSNRRFRFVPGRRSACQDLSCDDVEKLDASYVLRTEIVEMQAVKGGRACRVTVRLQRRDGTEVGRGSGRTQPCDLDGALLLLETATARATAGPRREPPPSAPLTLAPLPDLDLPSIPDVPLYGAETSTLALPPLDEALATYAAKRISVIEDGETLRFVQSEQLLGECGLRRAVDAPISSEVDTFCHGNEWVWAYLGVPVGGALAALSYPDLEQGNLHGFVGFSVGVLGALTSAALATAFMKSGNSPESGQYASEPRRLRALAEQRNDSLRRELGLSRAELQLLEAQARPSP